MSTFQIIQTLQLFSPVFLPGIAHLKFYFSRAMPVRLTFGRLAAFLRNCTPESLSSVVSRRMINYVKYSTLSVLHPSQNGPENYPFHGKILLILKSAISKVLSKIFVPTEKNYSRYAVAVCLIIFLSD